MEPIEFAARYLQPYTVRGHEIIPTYCPFCKGGKHRSKGTFALNIFKKTYNCKKSNCSAYQGGSFKQLMNHFGVRDEQFTEPSKHEYLKPFSVIKKAKDDVFGYLSLRGFSEETWEKYGVGESKGNLSFPFYDENNNLVMVKHRKPRKPAPGERKCWIDKGGKPVFFGMHLCDTAKPLIITEGEMDTLALAECGFENVVSIPFGAGNLECVDVCWDWLEQFQKIIIWTDYDDPGIECRENLIKRLGEWRCSYVDYSKHNDANEVLFTEGKEEVIAALNSAKEVPIEGAICLSDIKPVNVTDIRRVSTGFPSLDKILGGFRMGELTVVTGDSNAGKSTILGQCLLTAIDSGFNVACYSGELIAYKFKNWIDIQALGPDYVGEIEDQFTHEPVPAVPVEYVPALNDWYRDKFFLYDNKLGASLDGLLQVFENLARRKNVSLFMIDNLMTLSSAGSQDYYREQGLFVGQLIDFAHHFNCHVLLVAHKRKNDSEGKSGIAGSGEIYKRADNILEMIRVPDYEKNDIATDPDARLAVLKNRFYGIQDRHISLFFDIKCKRFYGKDDYSLRKQYGWLSHQPNQSKKDQDADFEEMSWEDIATVVN